MDTFNYLRRFSYGLLGEEYLSPNTQILRQGVAVIGTIILFYQNWGHFTSFKGFCVNLMQESKYFLFETFPYYY